jgi:predicted ArsR family transcriptional regulator
VIGWTRPERILETTRGRVLELLRHGDMTADELALALGLTDNAVRAHLATLERDGFVRSAGARREGRVGKPATLYQLPRETEQLFSTAYLPFLTSLLAVLGERMTPKELGPLLREVGEHMAAGVKAPSGELSDRVRAAAALLNSLGGMSGVQEVEQGTQYTIQSRGCPLSTAVRERPEVCQAVVKLVSELTGAKVRSCCTRGDKPSCCFEVQSVV